MSRGVEGGIVPGQGMGAAMEGRLTEYHMMLPRAERTKANPQAHQGQESAKSSVGSRALPSQWGPCVGGSIHNSRTFLPRHQMTSTSSHSSEGADGVWHLA